MNSVYLLTAFVSLQVCLISGEKPKIIIIGAGPAGIAAATYLLENGMTNIEILEAESRIGGRIHSVTFGNSKIDMGAEWCDGEKNNIIYEKVKHLNLLTSSGNRGYIPLYHSTRGRISKELFKEITEIMDDIESHLSEHASNITSSGDYCLESYNKAIHQKFGNDREKLKIAQDALEIFHVRTIAISGAFSWFDIASITNYQVCPGDRELNWKGKGFNTFLEVIMKKYPDPRNQLPIDNKVLLNKEVDKIYWESGSSSNKVEIFCSDGSTYRCDHVIFTPSIGVLKEKGRELFEPSLPPKKIEAINNIGFGAMMKVFMYFSKPWWKDTPGFWFVWDKNDMDSFQYPDGPHSNGRSWITYISVVKSLDYDPNVLSIWFTGNLVPAIEVVPEEKMKDAIYFVLNKFLGHFYDISKPDKIIQSKWYTNPHFRGTNSFQTLHTCNRKGGKCAGNDLAEPLKDVNGRPIVQFAGEATHPYYYSSVHGATETGYREAKTLVDLYKDRLKY